MELLLHLAGEVLNTPLAILPSKAAAVVSVLGKRIGLDEGGIRSLARMMPGPVASERRPDTAARSGYTNIGAGIALISAVGTLTSRAGYLDANSGLVSYERLKAQVSAADRDPEVTSILLDLHTPGGAVAGCVECAEVIHQVSRRRPLVAVANTMTCSAGMAIAAAANRVVAAPTSLLGSVGVVYLHIDYSRQLDARGVTPTFITAGKHKADGNELEPLSKTVREGIQREVDACMGLLVDSIVRHRPRLTEKAVRDTEAKVYMGQEAVAIGFADEVGSIEGVISQLAKLHAATKPDQKFDKYAKIERLYGQIDATRARLNDAHVAGLRAGMAAALAGRSDAK